jgi:hypothetical protein
MTTRIYCVKSKDATASVRLVRAIHRAQALGHVAGTTYDVRVADQDDIVNAMTAGAKVETAGSADDQPELPIT